MAFSRLEPWSFFCLNTKLFVNVPKAAHHQFKLFKETVCENGSEKWQFLHSALRVLCSQEEDDALITLLEQERSEINI